MIEIKLSTGTVIKLSDDCGKELTTEEMHCYDEIIESANDQDYSQSDTIKWIRENFEWSFGCREGERLGGCPKCNGYSEEWMEKFGGPGDVFGHKKDCSLAQALEKDGFRVVWEENIE